MEGLIIKINETLDVFPINSILTNCKRMDSAVKLVFSNKEVCYLLVGCKHNGKEFYVDEYVRHNESNDHRRRFITRGRNTASNYWGRKIKDEKPKEWALRSSILVSRQ